jgi:glutathione peroxidase
MEIAMTNKNIYQFKVEDLSGNTFDFASPKEKYKWLPKCLTPQYKDELYKAYQEQRLCNRDSKMILFPQEPGNK